MIQSEALVSKFKMEQKHFTRNRKQTFCGTLLFMINMLRKSLAVEIDNFVHYLSEKMPGKAPNFTTSAFIQNRNKINPEVFKHLSSVIVDNFYIPGNDDLQLFKGFRILSVDGSVVILPFTAELKDIYGTVTNAASLDVVQAKVSVLYDVLNRVALDAEIGRGRADERELALKHRHQWRKGDLIIYDRGYPSFGFINEHINAGVDCLIRVKTKHSTLIKAFADSGKKSLVTFMYPDQDKSFKGKNYNRKSSIQVRLLRIELPGGEVEILITTLLDSKKYPHNIFKKLYFLRWGIETFYDEFKNKIKAEHFSGYSNNTIKQDIFCAVFISNLQSVIVSGLQDELRVKNRGKEYEYKVNTNQSYGFLKNRVIELLWQKAPMEDVFRDLESLFVRHTVPIREHRTNDRDMEKYRYKTKPIVTKNHRDAI